MRSGVRAKQQRPRRATAVLLLLLLSQKGVIRYVESNGTTAITLECP